jgi:cell division protein FtsL
LRERFKFKKWFGLNDEVFFKNLPFVVFLTSLGFLYITNSYYLEQTVREMESVKNEINDQNNEFVITKTQVSIMGQRNEVVEKVGKIGLKESKKPPFQLRKNTKRETK